MTESPSLIILLCFCRPVGLPPSDITVTRARRHVVFLQWAQEQGLWQSWGGIKTYTQMAALMWCQVSPWSATATRGGDVWGRLPARELLWKRAARGNRSSLFVSMGFCILGPLWGWDGFIFIKSGLFNMPLGSFTMCFRWLWLIWLFYQALIKQDQLIFIYLFFKSNTGVSVLTSKQPHIPCRFQQHMHDIHHNSPTSSLRICPRL